jgi:hypothetical protein
VLKRGEQ